MQHSRVRRVGALLVGLSLVAAACGDDDETDTAAEPTETATATLRLSISARPSKRVTRRLGKRGRSPTTGMLSPIVTTTALPPATAAAKPRGQLRRLQRPASAGGTTMAGPSSTLALTRQNLPALRTEYVEENLCAYGAYELETASDEAKVTIFATGSEVEIAVKARAALEAKGVPTRVVSMPCMELFNRQDAAYRKAIIGSAPVRVVVEAGIEMGWGRILGDDGIFVGMSGFGASGPYEDLYKHFGITAEAIVEKASAALAKA